jgi:ankyrin repeat protein
VIENVPGGEVNLLSTVDEFIAAIKRNDVAEVQALLDESQDLVHAKDGDNSAVLTAVYYGARDVVPVLLERGAVLNFFEAVAVGEVEQALRMLNESPSLATAYSHDGFTGLMLASFFGHFDIVKELLSRGAEVNAVARNPMKVMALHSAVARKHTQIAQLLMEHGADVNAAQQGGFTPLLEAVHNEQVEMVGLLLAHGADPNQKNDEGVSPLALAQSRGNATICTLLTDHGAIESVE